MKNLSLFLTMGLVILSLDLIAQVKVAGNGNVGINTLAPAFKLDLNSLESRSYYSNRNALHINHFGTDPRLCSNEKIVFSKINGTGYTNIECGILLQHCTSQSDEKTESLENKGLVTIKKLKGVVFNTENGTDKGIEYGFLAEDVESVIPEAVFKNDSTSDASLAYSYIIPYLVEAVKEQQVLIEELKVVVTSLVKTMTDAGMSITSSKVKTEAIGPKARLDQNIPNPFNHQTKIGCFIPEGANSSILFNCTLNGSPISKYLIPGKGQQIITINGEHLVPGTYFYKLIIDGQEIGSRKMIFTR